MKFHICLVWSIGILILSPFKIRGQISDSDKAFSFLQEGKALDYVDKYQEAFNLYQEAAICYAELDSSRLESVSRSLLGNMYIELSNYDAAEEQFCKAQEIAIKGSFRLEDLNAKEGLTKLMSLRGNGPQALLLFREIIAQKEILVGPLNPDLAVLYNFMGGIYGNKGNFDLAITHFTKGLEIREKAWGENDDRLASSYYNIGHCYRTQRDYHRALMYFQKSLNVKVHQHGFDNLILLHQYIGIGTAYIGLTEYDKARISLEKGDEILKQNLGERSLRRQWVLYNLAQIERLENKPELAIKYLEERLSILRQHLPEDHRDVLGTLGDIGHCYAKSGNDRLGRQYLEKAIRVADNAPKGRLEEKKGELYLDLAEVHRSQSRFNQAILCYQKGLDGLSWGKAITQDPSDNPSLEEIVDWPFVLGLLYGKSLALFSISKNDPNHPYHQLATETLLHAAELIDLIRIRMKTATAQESLSQRGKAIYQTIIKLAYQRYQVDQSDEALELAFWAAEKNKAFLLLRNTQKLAFNRQHILPDSLLTLEAELKVDISYFETQLHQSRDNEQTASFRELQNELFAKRIAYDSLIQHLEIQYPRYFQAQYPTERATVSEIQARLQNSPQTTWIEYAWGDSSLFAFVIEANRRELVAINTPDNLGQEISTFCRKLSGDVNFSENASQKLLEFTRESRSIFRQIVEPLQTYFAPDTKQLIIIPDRELFQLPFELLLTTEADNPSSYKDLPYLLHQIQVQYDASATIWDLQMQASAQSHNQQSLIFAYDGNVDSGYDLETEDEADMIQSLIGGAIFKGAQASKDQFRRISSEYGLLHLGCHAQLDDVNPQFSALYLAQNAAGDGKLSIQELSQSNLNAELAVLSACETGKGKYLDGEGLVSLTSGFLNAGVPAVVMSLWQVEDQSTQKLMGYFYQNLALAMDKDQALHEAKIHYLRLADPISAHPRFWAAFVAQGNMEPVSFLAAPTRIASILSSWVFWLSLSLILAVLAIYLGKKRRNAKFSGIPK